MFKNSIWDTLAGSWLMMIFGVMLFFAGYCLYNTPQDNVEKYTSLTGRKIRFVADESRTGVILSKDWPVTGEYKISYFDEHGIRHYDYFKGVEIELVAE